ncbi:MAG: molybdopterin-dependent oxidoreductase, partial [Crenarchaeota archaeon]|nr:molybdopterin-dependent oxidoreductase [Thermoproteota archaeon]
LPRRVEGLEPGARLGSPLEGPLAPAWEPPPPAEGGPRQKPVPRFIVYRAEPAAPEHPGVLEVELPGGRVESFTVGGILVDAEFRRIDFHCVTGWSVEGRRWFVTPLEKLVPIPGGGCWAAAESAGGYTAVLPCSEARRALLALGVDGRPLPRENGGPLRLLAPSLYGWKSVKWLTRIRIMEGYRDGFWEALGYHERGLWSREERFKIRNPELPTERLEP